MFGTYSARVLAKGLALVVSAKRYVARTETLESWTGALLIAAFGLLGAALAHFP
ncbi:hypothetical protein ACVIGB_008494 [Bradyrhizobium sp. USDA 4341]